MGYKLVKIESGGAQQERRITHKIDIRGYPECDFSSDYAQRAYCSVSCIGDIRTVPRAAEIPGTGTNITPSSRTVLSPLSVSFYANDLHVALLRTTPPSQ